MENILEKNNRINKTIRSYYDQLVEKGYNVIAVFLYGSQNYKLDTEDSDIDAKAIVLPTLNDMIMRKHLVSKIIDMSDGKCDVKDIRLVMDAIKNHSLNDVEILFTPHYYVREDKVDILKPLQTYKEEIARCNVRAGVNQIYERAKKYYDKMQKAGAHNKELIEKYGYNPKCVAHVLRLYDMIYAYCKGFSYGENLVADNLLDVKKGVFSCEEATDMAKEAFSKMQAFKNRWIEENEFTAMIRHIETDYYYRGGGTIRTIENLLDAVAMNAIRHDIARNMASKLSDCMTIDVKMYTDILYETM